MYESVATRRDGWPPVHLLRSTAGVCLLTFASHVNGAGAAAWKSGNNVDIVRHLRGLCLARASDC
jgi:hypothetical protein